MEVVREYTIFHGRDLKWPKIDTIRARAWCKQIGYTWQIFCSWSKVTTYKKLSNLDFFGEAHMWKGLQKEASYNEMGDKKGG